MTRLAWSASDPKRRAEAAHYRLLSALYFKERQDLPWASVFFAKNIPDPEWNHAAALDLESERSSPEEAEARINELRDLFRSRGLPLTLAVGPLTRPIWPATNWQNLGFEPYFRQVWHFAQQEPEAPLELSQAIAIKEVRQESEMQAFLDVFASVYAVDLETGEPETLPAGYAPSLLRSFQETHKDLRVVHYLATVEGRPAGVSTSIHGLAGEIQGISGLYNLAVHSDFRRQGLGGALVRRRAADARALGQEIIFLQTERESVERRLPQHGFAKGFVTRGWTSVS